MSINESRQGRYKSCVILAEIMHFHEQPRRRNSQRRFAALRHPIFFFFFSLSFINSSPIDNRPGLSFPFRINGNESLFIFPRAFRIPIIATFIATRDSTRATSSLLLLRLLTVADPSFSQSRRCALLRRDTVERMPRYSITRLLLLSVPLFPSRNNPARHLVSTIRLDEPVFNRSDATRFT